MKKIVIGDLFGGLNGSLSKALEKDKEKYDIYTFDILPKTKDGKENIVVDLTSENVINELREFPKPDYIVASPMCMSFSRAAAMKGGNASGKVIDGKLFHREESDYIGTRYKFEDQKRKAILGKLAIINTIQIIKLFEPKCGYIENPASSLIGNFIKYNLGSIKGNLSYFNLTHYGAYGFKAKKPTIFGSNIPLNLKLATKGQKFKSFEYLGKVKNRSDIPKELLLEIITKFDKGGKKGQ